MDLLSRVYRQLPIPVPNWVASFRRSARRLQKSQNLTILYYPPFEDTAAYTDHYYRMIWYLHPILGQIKRIVLPFRGNQPGTLSMPDYLDPAITAFEPAFQGKLTHLDTSDYAAFQQAAADADIVMVWRSDMTRADHIPDSPLSSIIRRKTAWRIDHDSEQFAGSFYLYTTSNIGSQEREIAESREKFAHLLNYPFKQQGYIFGTGPNLQMVSDFDFSQGTCIACNSMVTNRPLMEQLQPPVITIADAIFHAGCSSYAGEFRRHLLEAMDAFGSYLVVPMRDYRLYMANLPVRYQDRIIGIPFTKRSQPNLDLKKQFDVTTTSNIMTLFLLPLACTFFKTIGMAGFDGRPIEENDYFWKHDPQSQLPEKMNAIQRAHPRFFAIDYDEYYMEHVAVVETWLEAGKHQGHRFTNLTPSYIPALQRCTGKRISA